MLSYFPTEWKKAITVPIRKPGKPSDDIKSYRPISLLSTLSKIFERIILKRMNEHIEANQLIPNFQFGFRQAHSTTHQLMRVVKQVRSGFSHTKSTGMVLMDLKCAFDSVWHDAIVFKMNSAGFPLYLTKIVQSFLTHRTLQVKVNDSLSDEKCIPAGVAQGAVLSPTLFNIFIADLPANHFCEVAQYADDVAFMFTHKRGASVKKQLQVAVNRFSKYIKKWKLKLNPQKSESIFFTRRRAVRAFPNSSIDVEGHECEWSNSVKYLGMVLDSKLTLKKHIDYTIEKAGKCIKMLYPLLARNSRLNTRSKLLLYKSILRPILLYAPSIINTAAKTNIQTIQRYQNRILKMALNRNWRYPTESLHDEAEIETVNLFLDRLSLAFEQRSRLVDNPLIDSLYD